MSKLAELQSASTLHDVANLLDIPPKILSFILYRMSNKYINFGIPKRSGGVRTINAPRKELMSLQRKLSNFLQDCIVDINKARNIETAISHGFRRKHSIITNATVHRNKRYIFNLDLEDFFGTIHFGRVRGFFISNHNFLLKPKVATILAQIACYQNSLPQGSPCSPVISNLIGHILDMRLVKLAKKVGCSYSRYADDLTFSTNKQIFPENVAIPLGSNHQWIPGKELETIIERSGFKINKLKTRMQYSDSRQDVTGLVVNRFVNTRVEYRQTIRAMVHRVIRTGAFQITTVQWDSEGKPVIKIEKNGTLNQLNGMLSFIDSVNHFRKKKMKSSQPNDGKKTFDTLDGYERLYKHFLFYKNFVATPLPVIIFEGKTDNVYLRSAIRRLIDEYPRLADKDASGSIRLKVRLFKFTEVTGRILGLSGGTGHLARFTNVYFEESKHIGDIGNRQPVILLIDNDSGRKKLLNVVKERTNRTFDPSSNFIFVTDNLYIIPTPFLPGGGDSKIEDFFEESDRQIKISGKIFNPSNKGLNPNEEFGKSIFAEYIKNHENQINFGGFRPILDRVQIVMDEHLKPSEPENN